MRDERFNKEGSVKNSGYPGPRKDPTFVAWDFNPGDISYDTRNGRGMTCHAHHSRQQAATSV